MCGITLLTEWPTSIPDILASIIGLGLGLAVIGCAGGILLRMAAKWVLGREVPFTHAVVTCLIAYPVNLVAILPVGALIGLLSALSGLDRQTSTHIAPFAAIPTAFILLSGVIAIRLKVGFGKGMLITLVMLIILLGVGLIVGAATLALRQLSP